MTTRIGAKYWFAGIASPRFVTPLGQLLHFLFYPFFFPLLISTSLASDLIPVASENFPGLYRISDTCQVYVLKANERALLIDLGSGKVLDQLPEIGVKHLDWVLFTHHHREQCQGIDRVDRSQTKIAAPHAEQELFENPLEFRKWHPKLNDRYSVYGASYVRPPRQPIRLDRTLADHDVFEWEGYKIECLATPGHSPGSMTYLLQRDEHKVAFTGGLVHDGEKMTTWFDTEWDYGFAKGIDTLIASVQLLRQQEPTLLLPSHGPPIFEVKQLDGYLKKLDEMRVSYLRGYPVFDLTNEQRDSLSTPTEVPLLSRVTPHLYKLRDATKGRNFAIIIADSGKALVLDCGLFPEPMLDEIILGAREHLGLKQIDAFWISHMHGDHFLLGPVMKQKYGAQAWTLGIIADRCENPRRYDYAALVSAYGDGFDGMKIDRSFRDGESIEWEGYRIQIDWMPGQTEFGCCLWLELDGKRIAFTGDNLFGNPADPQQNGHEAVVARNSCLFAEGYIHGSRYLLDLKPDIVMGSHSFVMDQPQKFLERYHAWSLEIEGIFKRLLPDKDYEYLFDPYWVSAYPYRVELQSDHEQTDRKQTDRERMVEVTVRNHRSEVQSHRIELVTPPGVTAIPKVLVGSVLPKSRSKFPVTLQIDPRVAPQGMSIIPFDIELDGKHYGQWFDFLVRIGGEPETRP